ncbi:hypothetical protein OAS47_03830 [Pelagibacteraceae bacterium]|nr:hypothetical protein [Pelagibacteraceae bacterium]
MATINLGAIKFNWKGPYNNSTAYVVDDVVSSSGSSYVCILASQGNAVSSGTYWQVMSQAGTNGSSGDTFGLANKEIAFKTNAGALDGIAIGTAGQALKVNSGATGYEFGDTSGGLVKTTTYTNFNRTTLSSSSNSGAILSPVIAKVKDATTSKVIVTGVIPTHASSGYFTGQYFDCLSSGMLKHDTNDSTAFAGLAHGYYSGQGPGVLMINKEFEDTSNFGVGNHTFEYGFRPRNGATDQPYGVINPNHNDDARAMQQGTFIIFQEVLR